MEIFTTFLTELYYPALAFFATLSLYMIAMELKEIKEKMK